jgi:2-polyprenyl-3-methyl-5-hydroxy-6-metoxy-1,4-benzoquinol methylase
VLGARVSARGPQVRVRAGLKIDLLCPRSSFTSSNTIGPAFALRCFLSNWTTPAQRERAGDYAGHVSELNRAWWDERVPLHVGSEFYDVESFKRGRDPLRPFELEEVGDVAGKSLVHLQCHFGLDTLAWARHGARVAGLDFSAPAIEAARQIAEDIGVDAEFVQADLYDAPRALGGRRFDVVYTGLGALNWLPDVKRWAEVVASLVEPGGCLYLSEFHPFSWVFGDDDLTVEYDYFHQRHEFEDAGTYADLEARTEHNKTEEWQHTLGEVVTAVIDAGLTVEFLHEHDYTLFPQWPLLEKSGFDTYRLPEGRPRIPLMFSLRARAG